MQVICGEDGDHRLCYEII